MADWKKIAAGSACVIVMGVACFLGIKGCANDRKQNERIADLENVDSVLFANDEALAHSDSVLFANDEILDERDSAFGANLDSLGREVSGLRHDVDSVLAKLDSCCDCNKKPVKKSTKPRKTGVADTTVVESVKPVQRPNNQPTQPQGASSITVSDGNAVIVNGNNNNTTVVVPGAGVQIAADTVKAIRATVRCTWQNVR